MQPTPAQLRRDALQIWRAGVDAVLPQRLVPRWLRIEGQSLLIGDATIPLDTIRQIAVVGAGKAGAGMAEAVEVALGPKLMAEKHFVGWVNVPADVAAGGPPTFDVRQASPIGLGGTAGLSSSDCGTVRLSSRVGGMVRLSGSAESTAGQASSATRPLNVQRIHLHAARPASLNEPTPEGVAGSMEILRLVELLGPDDLCLCLLSGGGSALMPAPVEGITLADKLAVTRHLSAAGANIEQLNTVRKHLSRIKGGGLLRACHARQIISLIISDVLGDPLDVIASGPTVPDSSTPRAALDVLEQFGAREAGIAPAVFEYLENASLVQQSSIESQMMNVAIAASQRLPECVEIRDFAPGAVSSRIFSHDLAPLTRNQQVQHIILANNTTAVAAAAEEAERLGYPVAAASATHSEGQAEEVGRDLAEKALAMRAGSGPTCLISGGEPVVKLVEPSRRGLGGRNQQVVLAALLRLVDDGAEGIVLLSGGTDGEDGPTDAAGALVDADVLAAASRRNLDPADYLARNDAYRFLAPLGALMKTGPTQTNVCDVRVVIGTPKPQAVHPA